MMKLSFKVIFPFWFAVSTVNGVMISVADKPNFGREIWIYNICIYISLD